MFLVYLYLEIPVVPFQFHLGPPQLLHLLGGIDGLLVSAHALKSGCLRPPSVGLPLLGIQASVGIGLGLLRLLSATLEVKVTVEGGRQLLLQVFVLLLEFPEGKCS